MTTIDNRPPSITFLIIVVLPKWLVFKLATDHKSVLLSTKLTFTLLIKS